MTKIIVVSYALRPTKKQEQAFRSHIGASRFAYNYGLRKIIDNWQAVKDGTETEYIDVSQYSMRKLFNSEKATVAPWWNENSKEAYSSGFAHLHIAMKNFYAKRSGFPKMKHKSRDYGSGVTFTTSVRRLEEDRKHFTLPTIGTVALHERATKLAYLLRHGGTIGNVTVREAANRWMLSVNVRVADDLWNQYHLLRTKKDKKRVVGVDLGIKNAAVFSDGTVIENIAAYEKELAKLRRLNKRLARRRCFNKTTKAPASKRYEKTRKQLRKTYGRVSNIEKDFTHKLSKDLVDNFEIIGLEDLNVAGMVQNRRLARRIAHASFARLRTFTEYKADRYGSQVVIVDRFYLSSKTCSNCGEAKAKLSLSERTFKCNNCGVSLDRDLNAAINIRKYAENVAQSCGETLNGRGDSSAGSLSETTVSEAISGEVLPQPDLGHNISNH